jgi:DNA-binding NtrC family response regulator
VGDIPLDLQPKLLRALQEKAFESWAAPGRSRLTFDWLRPPTGI